MSDSRGTSGGPLEPVDPSAETVPSGPDPNEETACGATAFGARPLSSPGQPDGRPASHFGSRASAAGAAGPAGAGAGFGAGAAAGYGLGVGPRSGAGAGVGPGSRAGAGLGSGSASGGASNPRSGGRASASASSSTGGREGLRREDPSRVGKYELIRRIAEGGMGTVFLGRDTTLQQRRLVAIKLVRQGFVTREARARFEREIRVLAGLDHPCVARFLGHGEVEGRPYFVLDFVEGNEIDRYADRHELSVRQRLDLFCRICEGIEHVHGNAIIHRDLKPANIMVTEDGTPKILDFGIAKILSDSLEGDHPMLTQGGTGRSPMTPVYASPEQLNGEATDVRTDVYSLGLILYEMLTGHRAHDVAGGKTQEIARVRETRPAAPSLRLRSGVTIDSRRGVVSDVADPDASTGGFWTRRKTGSGATATPAAIGRAASTRNGDRPHGSRGGAAVATQAEASPGSKTLSADELARRRRSRPGELRAELRGDLDRIVLKALDPSPTHRYRSVEALRADIQRHLDGMPIQARPPSKLYVTRKFVRRHRAMVLSSVVGVLGTSSLVAGVMIGQDKQIGDLETVTVSVQEQLQTSFDRLADDLGDRNLPPTVREEYARLSAEFAGLQAGLDGASPEVLESAADGFAWASRVAASRVSEDSGDFAAAAGYRRRAMETYDGALAAATTDDARARVTLGQLRMERDEVLARDIAGEDEGVRAANELAAILERVPAGDGLDPEVQVERMRFRSITSVFVADQLSELRDPPVDPSEAFAAAVDANRDLVDLIGPPARRNLVSARNKYRTWLTRVGRHAEAVDIASAVTAGRRQLAAAAPDDPRARRDLANALASEVAARMADEQFDATVVRRQMDEAIATLRPLYELPGERRKVSQNYAVALVNAGGISMKQPAADRNAEQLLIDLDHLAEAAAVAADAPQSGAAGDIFGLVLGQAAIDGQLVFQALRAELGDAAGWDPDVRRQMESITTRFRAANTVGQFDRLLQQMPRSSEGNAGG